MNQLLLPTLYRGLARGALFPFACILAPLAVAAEPAYDGPFNAGVMAAPPRQEASGLTPSRRAQDILWTHDDSNGAPVLYAVSTSGKKRGALRLQGVKNEDWEGVASFAKEGKSWLVIADTGDNDAERKTVRLHVVEEPDPARLKSDGEVTAAPAFTLRFRYEDGPHDCEAIAVDPSGTNVYLLTKRDHPTQLYQLALRDMPGKIAVAHLIGPVPQLIGRTQIDSLIKHVVGKRFSWPTGMDFAADGSAAVVLTYGEPLVFLREGNEPWADTFKRPPLRLLFHGMPQAEGICFSADSQSIYVVSESSTALIRYDRAGK